LDDGSWEGVDGRHCYRLSTIADGETGRTSLLAATNGDAGALQSFFRLDRDAAAVEAEILLRGAELKPAVEQLLGIRLLRHSDPVETIFCFICSANNNLNRIIPMCWRLGTYGEPLEDGLYAFPTIERIAEIEEADLRSHAFGYRAATIPRVAKEIVSRGESWLINLKKANYEEAHGELCSLPGIGPKLADCICLYGLDHSMAVPLDTHIWQAFTRLYHPKWKNKAVTDFRYREATGRFRDRFGDLSGWAHLFLFYENLLRSRKRRPAMSYNDDRMDDASGATI